MQVWVLMENNSDDAGVFVRVYETKEKALEVFDEMVKEYLEDDTYFEDGEPKRQFDAKVTHNWFFIESVNHDGWFEQIEVVERTVE